MNEKLKRQVTKAAVKLLEQFPAIEGFMVLGYSADHAWIGGTGSGPPADLPDLLEGAAQAIRTEEPQFVPVRNVH
jgi:hypothetical protein